MSANKTILIGAVAVIAVLLSGTFYVALSSASANTGDTVAQTVATGTVVSSNSTARIVVSGTGTVTYVPDEAIVTIGVMNENATVSQATSWNAATASGIIKALNAIGISNSSMETQGYSVNPDYYYNSNDGAQSITGYTVTYTLSVNVTSSTCSACAGGVVALGQRAAQVLGTATQAGANQVSFGFALSNQLTNQLETQALQGAVQDASSQAGAIAGALGVRVTGVIQVTDTGASVPQVLSEPGVEGAVTSSSSAPILPGTSTFSATVEAVYAIS